MSNITTNEYRYIINACEYDEMLYIHVCFFNKTYSNFEAHEKKFYAQVFEIHVWLNYRYDSLNMYNFNTGVYTI